MEKQFAFNIGKNTIRFTPEGKVAVLDAIKTLYEPDEPAAVWEFIKNKRPELNNICSKYKFGQSRFVPVVDNTGWGQIEDALLDYVFEQDAWN